MYIKFKRILLLIGAICCFVPFLLSSHTALADEGKIAIRNEPVQVHEGQKMDGLIVVGHDATISGTVRDTVLVINGNVQLTSTSKTGLVVAIGGIVSQQPGARVEDTAVSLDFNNALLNSALVSLLILVGAWGIRLAASILFVVVPVLFVLALKSRLGIDRRIHLLQQSPVRVGMIGLLVFVLASVISLLAGLTVIGFPITLILLIVLLITAAYGYSILAYLIGGYLFKEQTAPERPWFRTLKGALLITAFSTIPLFGWFLFFVVTMLSIGVAIIPASKQAA